MNQKYSDLYELMKHDKAARDYFNQLPEHLRSSIEQRAGGVNSFESLKSYTDNLTQGDI